MKRYRKTQIIVLIALVVSIAGVSLGFAAFSNILTITSSATVTPDSSTFKVEMHNSTTLKTGTGVSIEPVIGTPYNGASLGPTQYISNDGLIAPVRGVFTAPGQYIEYTFYIHNTGAYDAYLRGITYLNATNSSSTKACSASGTQATQSLVDAACDDFSITVNIGGEEFTEANTTTSGHKLAKGTYEKMVVTLTYKENGDVVDGDFSVNFGNVEIEYSSVDAELIGFTFNGNTYYAEQGMTWEEWINSSYNTIGVYIDSYDGICASGWSIPALKSSEIIAGKDYTTGETCEV